MSITKIINRSNKMMKCRKCGTEFEEGIFCPECGTRVEQEIVGKEEKNLEVSVEIERQKTEQARIEKEKVEKELELTKQKIEQQKLEVEQKKQQENEQKRIHEKRDEDERRKKQRKIENEGKTMGILSLIAGICSLMTLGCFVIPEVLGIVFALFGKKNGKMWGTAKVGLICSVISIIIITVIMIIAFVISN